VINVVRAAGGAVWRPGPDGVEVLVVHRPKYDDWTLPKGKADPGEDDLACALREVEEETGYVCEAGAELGATEYVDRLGRNKVVRYWAMRPRRGSFVPNHEVDAVRWLTLDDARDLVTYPHDAAIITRVAESHS